MRKFNAGHFLTAVRISILFVLGLILLVNNGIAQQIKVLAYNGSSSQEGGPQGALRYQRQFYLITPQEMSNTDLLSGSTIESIGFTIGLNQDVTTTGKFKVYLENTSDTISRVDTSWTSVSVSNNNYHAVSLVPGYYEWQVKAQCTESSVFSPIATFSNSGLSSCYKPDSLFTDAITDSSATVHWNTRGTQDSFLVEFKEFGTESWSNITTTNQNVTLNDLTENTNYFWRVSSFCSGEGSPASTSSFQTDFELGCSAPTDLQVGTVTDTLALLHWVMDDTTTSRYDIRYRRVSTSYWYNTISFTDSLILNSGLVPGTSYEWQVRTVCDTNQSVGAFVAGLSFMTTGDPVCYMPMDLMTSSITDNSAMFSWSEVTGATQYTMRYRLKETISWDNAIDSMTMVHDDSIVISGDVGTFFTPFVGDSSFTYTGNGLYVAWEYTNDTLPLSSFNTSLCHMQDLLRLSYSARTDTSDTSQKETLYKANLRPETWLGANSIKDSVEIGTIYAMGHNAVPFGNPTKIQVWIHNLSSETRTFPVTLKVKNQLTQAERHTASQDVSVNGDSSVLATFTGWSPENYETDSILISIPAQGDEELVNNNSTHYLQVVNPNLMSYADHADPLADAGFGHGSGSGLILNRHHMNGCGTVIGVKVHLDYSSIGHSVYAVVLDASGTVAAQSDSFVPDTTDVNQYYAFYLLTTPDFTNEDYYIGLAQTASSGDYYPVGVQWEGVQARSEAYYHASLDGSGLTETVTNGRFMIAGEIVPSIPAPFIYGDEILCIGSSDTLVTGSSEMRYANAVIDYSSQFQDYAYSARRALGAANVNREYQLSPEAWFSETSDDQREYLVLEFPGASPINHIQIYEPFNPGAVDTVYVKNPGTGDYEPVFSISPDSVAATVDTFRVFNIEFEMTAFNVSEIKITMNSPAVPGFNAIDAVAIGQRTAPAIYDSYLWSPGGQTTSYINISDEGSYEVEVEAGTCSASASLEVVTPESIAPTITATGPTTFCEGGSVVLLSSKVGGNTWSTDATTDSIIVSSSGFYTVSNDDGCDMLESDSIEVIVNPFPYVTITGGIICQGDTATLDAGAGYSEYAWSTGDSTQTIPATTTALFYVTVTDTLGCIGDTFVITSVLIPPSPHVSGDTGFCPGDSSVLDAGGGYVEYLWSTTAVTQTITVLSPGQVYVTVTDANGCSGTDDITITEFTAPAPFISGSLGICIGSSTQLDAGAGYASYAWSTGETSQIIIIDTVATFSVTVSDLNGCTGSTSATTTMDGIIPDPPGPITGPVDGLCGGSGVVYTIDPVLNAAFYVWTVPTGVTIISGAGTTSITVDMDGTFSGGDIVVAASNACGQSPSIDPTYLTIQGFPNPPGAVSGPVNITCDYTGHQYSISPVADATSYTWSVPEGATITGGQGTLAITVTFGDVSGDICVTADNSCGGSTASCLFVSLPTTNSLFVANALDSGSGSLRQAILDACWGDTIRFDSSLTGSTITLTSGEIEISKHVNIVGLGKGSLQLSGGSNMRIFHIHPGMIAFLKDISLIDGYSLLDGGAFYNQGTITLSDMRFSGNHEGTFAKAFTSDSHVVVKAGLVEVLQ